MTTANDNTETVNAELEEARRELGNWLVMYQAGIPFNLPCGWSPSTFNTELTIHYGAIMHGSTPIEALPRAQTFLELLSFANEVRS